MTDILGATVDRILAGQCSDPVRLAAEGGAFPEALWSALADAGLPHALVPDQGVEVAEALGVVRLVGRHAAPVPLAETMLANWLLDRAGLPPEAGPVAVVADRALTVSGGRVTGIAARVPWGRRAGLVVVHEQDGQLMVGVASREGVTVREGANIAREPRDHLTFERAVCGSAPLPAGFDRLRLRAAGAALRCALMAGALESSAGMTIGYARGRVQFGKPIAQFQAIQHSLAILAEQAALASAAADMAADAFDAGIRVGAIAAAKITAGEAAGVGAGLAHQVHGAMGFAQEYALHHRTRRLWSWREEDGSEAEWAAWLGRDLASAGADRLWAGITAL